MWCVREEELGKLDREAYRQAAGEDTRMDAAATTVSRGQSTRSRKGERYCEDDIGGPVDARTAARIETKRIESIQRRGPRHRPEIKRHELP